MPYIKVLATAVTILFTSTNLTYAQSGLLSDETLLMAVPEGMTYEEYQDMTRTPTLAVVLGAIPFPGMVHYYANEYRTQSFILGTAAIGVGMLLAEPFMGRIGKFPKSDNDLLIMYSGEEDRERRFEFTPTTIVGMDTTYELREISREPDGFTRSVRFLGAALISGAIVYDILHGIQIIQEKRDRVRFKYGKQLSISFKPEIDVSNSQMALRLNWSFSL